MIPLKFIYVEYIDRSKLSEKETIWVCLFPLQVGRNNSTEFGMNFQIIVGFFADTEKTSEIKPID